MTVFTVVAMENIEIVMIDSMLQLIMLDISFYHQTNNQHPDQTYDFTRKHPLRLAIRRSESQVCIRNIAAPYTT